MATLIVIPGNLPIEANDYKNVEIAAMRRFSSRHGRLNMRRGRAMQDGRT
jgi:hypothetical protein